MRWFVGVLFPVIACTGRGPEAPAKPEPISPVKAAPVSSGAAPQAALAPSATPPSGELKPPPENGTAPASQSSNACPADMKLVDGEYCTKLELTCKRSWYDKSNKKTVCEEFEPKSTCVGDKVKKRYCIDTYTWPNEKGARPEVMNRFHQAQVKCAAVGKRMCTESEWTLACEGPKMLPFPYGYVRDATKCHGDMEWDSPDMPKVAKRDPDELARLWQGVRNGSQPDCISAYGVADLPGNVDEVVASESFNEPDFKGKFDSIHSGGPWYKGVRNQCRPKIYTHDEGFYYYFLGFRCCAEADGAPNEPRTLKQLKEKWKFERVERMAGFTKQEMAQKLELKKQGKCECGEKDIRCKTMCGTLLGPSAKDRK